MNVQQYLLICLAEECAEVSQRITKTLRFGLTEIEPGQVETNSYRLQQELDDLQTVIMTLIMHGVIEQPQQTTAKLEKIAKYLEYSEKLGIVKNA